MESTEQAQKSIHFKNIKMTKIIVNRCFGGFGLSHEAELRLAELKGIKLWWDNEHKTCRHYYTNEDMTQENYYSAWDHPRDDPDLVKVVEELGAKANGDCAVLEIVEIPDGVNWEIHDYDGMETIHEQHRSW